MTASPPTPPLPGRGRLTATDASRLLRLGLHEPVRPIDSLLDRLSHPDGKEWLEKALQESAASLFGPPQHCLAEGGVSLSQLHSIKQQSKQLLAERKDASSRLLATIGYFFSIASALAHYNEVITTRPSQELLPVLEDLAAVTPPVWSTMFHRAATALSAKLV